ncbi:MAG: TetR/AcrR family transcriptional regulator [Gammaproteobacteria bacterium]|nr:TetR/AcrR family transcriptional regulator [Gammaproteobacteria bacterium]MDH4255194.1 TetR/AcrR family transcriptional regulator [Gammaproteobacteria bacterium]MDH5311502.1 TetR/AcrR family transcriptional regulator [Gammaproteobacteria bacterium]
MPAEAERASSATTSLTQAERTALSDRAMIEAAKELLLERGIEKTTLAAIGERAGYSRGLASYRYGTKAGLFDAVCRSIARSWLDVLNERVGVQTGTEAMCTALDSFFEFVSRHPQDAQVLQILYGAAASPEAEYRQTSADIHQRQLDDVAAWVRAGIDEGSIRPDVDPRSVATHYIAYISGMTYLWLISPESVDFQKANDDMKRHLRVSLRIQ